MIKYRKMIVFFIIGVLLIGSGAIYTILSAMGTDVQEDVSDKTKTSVKKTRQDVSETDVNEQIESLISEYLNAKLADDISAINTYVNDSEYIDEKKILKQNQYVESYSNIKCIIKECKKKGYIQSLCILRYETVRYRTAAAVISIILRYQAGWRL